MFVASALEGIVEPTLAGMGFELVDLQVSNRGRFLRILMDKPGGITVDDCASVSRHLSRLFEVDGIDYDRLEVSSPGLDRPLRKAADFARFAGQKVDVRMRLADANGRRRYIGRLMGIEGATATVEVDGAPVALPLDGMDRARLVPEL
ncbi:MAG: ribosome maturation factor RimP [Betaproteobacteria bacterium]|nr:ribosome maturation factor RimP [Betaproteobacteria bacterium]MDH5222230.1 ribosome maturation factor RimP [Betaproteobacteria bacterium]MDH5350362.1 ribosome maturation factor RimP [Betaproteobacteria bacterium]